MVDKTPTIPGGFYDIGIRDSKLAEQLGFGVVLWTHLEEAMIKVFSDLLSHNPINPARQIFRGISNNSTRIKVMKAMLQHSPQNVQKSSVYDELIAEFETLNELRNDYVHGLWHTNANEKKFFLSQPTKEEFTFAPAREVARKEIGEFLGRMIALDTKIKMRVFRARMRREP